MAPSFVEVSGIGKLPNYFSKAFDGIDFRNTPKTNGHHEGSIRLLCGEEKWGPKDDFNISGWKTADGYQLDVLVDSESLVGLYRRGRIVFDYNQASGRWSFKAYVPGKEARREWLFCDPNAVVDALTSGLSCFQKGLKDQELQRSLDLIISSLAHDKNTMIQSASLYTERGDCAAPPITEPEPIISSIP